MTNRIQCVRCHQFLPPSVAPVHVAGCQRYCGWTNYETWNVALWLTNSAPSDRYWRNMAKICRHSANEKDGPDHSAVALLAAQLQSEHEDDAENALLNPPSVFSDLLRTALCEVDWREIAESLLDG